LTVNLKNWLHADNGWPLAGKEVNAYKVGETTPTATTTTDADGMWQFSSLADGSYDVEVISGRQKRVRKGGAKVQFEELSVTGMTWFSDRLCVGTSYGDPGAGNLRVGGKIGIGITPTNQLDILTSTGGTALNTTVNGYAYNRFVAASSGVGDAWIINSQRSRGTIASPADVAAGDCLSALTFDGYKNGAFRRAADIIVTVDSIGASSVAGYMSFYTTNSAGSRAERVRIYPSGGVVIGNTTDPGANNLWVMGASNAAGFIRSYASSGTPGFVAGNHSSPVSGTTGQEGLQIYYDMAAHSAYYKAVKWGTSYYGTAFYASSFNFRTGTGTPTESLTIYSSGGVCVSDTPSDPGVNNLSVKGTVTFNGILLNGTTSKVSFDASSANFLTGPGAALGGKFGSLVVSDSYSDTAASKCLFVKQDIRANGYIYAGNYMQTPYLIAGPTSGDQIRINNTTAWFGQTHATIWADHDHIMIDSPPHLPPKDYTLANSPAHRIVFGVRTNSTTRQYSLCCNSDQWFYIGNTTWGDQASAGLWVAGKIKPSVGYMSVNGKDGTTITINYVADVRNNAGTYQKYMGQMVIENGLIVAINAVGWQNW
jgi:hypothetical protein